MSKSSKKVVESKTVLTAPNLKRLAAFVIDYVIVYLLMSVIGNIVITLLFPEAESIIDVYGQNVGAQVLFFSFLILLSILYFVVTPIFIFREDRVGQTVGKRIMGLKTIRVNGTDVTLVTLIIRTLFMLLGEGMVMFSIFYVLEIIGKLGVSINIIGYLSTAYIMVTLVSCTIMIIRPNRQMFHDYIANTVVILYDQKVRR